MKAGEDAGIADEVGLGMDEVVLVIVVTRVVITETTRVKILEATLGNH